MKPIVKSFKYGRHTVTLETGVIGRQADAAVMASMDDTSVFVTVVGNKNNISGNSCQDSFSLNVDYQERSYAYDQLPGGLSKRENREGHPSEKETLITRLIDRPFRQLFPADFTNDVQINVILVSANPEISSDVISLIGVSAALSISGMPFKGPLGAAKIGYINGQYILNPLRSEITKSRLDLVTAGTSSSVLMVESEADILHEDVMLGAVMYAHEQMQTVIDNIKEFATEVNHEPLNWQPLAADEGLKKAVEDFASSRLSEAYSIADKIKRQNAIKSILNDMNAEFSTQADENHTVYCALNAYSYFHSLEKKIVRERILNDEPRIDGRTAKMVRPLTMAVGLLPRVHGSALFTRGETQSLVTCTLDSEHESMNADEHTGEQKDNFLLYYNLLPYCVGETNSNCQQKRSELSHDFLAKKALAAVIPDTAVFPYTIRVVSEITESNGSSSMASVCGGSLALFDAGVPCKAAVAGVAMGLVKEGDRCKILTDILGDEDHLGDMDFKVAGTAEGITALQMDFKIDGISYDIMTAALKQAREARLYILSVMDQVLAKPREHLSKYALQIKVIHIDPSKIREVIGKNGSVIRSISEESGCKIDVSNDGAIRISAKDSDAASKAEELISNVIQEVEIGGIYHGHVTKITDFGAFVNIMPNKDGLVHISQISWDHVNNVSDYLCEGQEVDVKVLAVDRQNRIKLSIKELSPKPEVENEQKQNSEQEESVADDEDQQQYFDKNAENVRTSTAYNSDEDDEENSEQKAVADEDQYADDEKESTYIDDESSDDEKEHDYVEDEPAYTDDESKDDEDKSVDEDDVPEEKSKNKGTKFE